MTKTEIELARARLKAEDRIFFRNQHIKNVCAIIGTFFAVFVLWLAWYNNIIF